MRRSNPSLLLLAASMASLLACSSDDTTETPAPEPAGDELAPPPAGAGFQFQTDEILVPPGTEEQDCYFFKASDLAKAGGLPSDEPFHLHRIELAQREGSHHMNLFRVKTIVKHDDPAEDLDPANGPIQKATNGVGPCFKSANWADWPLIANTQTEGQLDWTYPEGVGDGGDGDVVSSFEPDEWIMLQTHWVNATTQKTPESAGRVRVNFWTVPDSPSNVELGTLFATKQSIRICQSNPTPTFEGSCQFNSSSAVNIIGANGHFHSRGKEFQMFSWDGVSAETPSLEERFYDSVTWDDPPMLHSPELDLGVKAGAGVWYTCSYDWTPPSSSVGGCQGLDDFDEAHYSTPDSDLDCCYTFGPIVELNEHCNIFVYYYPKIDDVNCF